MIRRAVIALALVACNDSTAEQTASDAALGDATPDAPPMIASGFPATLSIAASHGTIADAFQAAISGSGVAIAADTGTMVVDGESGSTALYNTEMFSGYQIFGGVVIAPDRWSIAYPYCQGSELVDIYAEPVGTGGFALSPASGTCAISSLGSDVSVALPAFSIPAPYAVASTSVHGAQIELDDGAGQIAVKGTMLPAVVFDTVDCSTSCGSPGWYELHTLVWDDANHAATFVIVYLELGSTTSVQLAYALRLPNVDDPIGDQVLAATWTAPVARAAIAEPPHLPPPWALASDTRPVHRD